MSRLTPGQRRIYLLSLEHKLAANEPDPRSGLWFMSFLASLIPALAPMLIFDLGGVGYLVSCACLTALIGSWRLMLIEADEMDYAALLELTEEDK